MANFKPLNQVITELENKGIKVEYTIRPNKSPLITKIGRKSFKGFEGNKQARELTGSKLSRKQYTQRRNASRGREVVKQAQHRRVIEKSRREARKRYLRETEPSEAIEKQMNRVRKAIKDNDRKAELRKEQVRRAIHKYGKRETLRMLKRQERYYQGYAYAQNVDFLIARIEQVFGKEAFKIITNYLNKHKSEIMEKDIGKAHEMLYDYIHALQTQDTSLTETMVYNAFITMFNIETDKREEEEKETEI